MSGVAALGAGEAGAWPKPGASVLVRVRRWLRARRGQPGAPLVLPERAWPGTVAGMEDLGWSDWMEHGFTAAVPEGVSEELKAAYHRGNMRESTLW